jgi:hypothetical protein
LGTAAKKDLAHLAVDLVGREAYNRVLTPMQKKVANSRSSRDLPTNDEVSSALAKELWMRPSSNFRQESPRWREGNISPTSGQRFLALADAVLGGTKPLPKKKPKSVPAATHLKRKTVPYSG